MKLSSNIVGAGLLCCAVLSANPAWTQPTVPLRELSKPQAISLLSFGAIESLHPLVNGGVLVNDTRFRQLVVMDSVLLGATVTIDSTSDAPLRYGPLEMPLIRYVGDSVLFRDATSNYFLVIDPRGNVAHRLIRAKPGEVPLRYPMPKAHDTEGNPIAKDFTFGMPDFKRWYLPRPEPIIRVNFATRREEQIAVAQVGSAHITRASSRKGGSPHVVRSYNPFVLTDDWAVLSDGTVAVVRGKDYVVELYQPTGKKSASTKLPFERVQLSEAEKQAAAEAVLSAARLENLEMGANTMEAGAVAGMTALLTANSDSLKRVARRSPNGSFRLDVNPKEVESDIEVVPTKDMLNDMPPFRPGAVITDLDARVWILTTSTAGVGPGESLYDVVNNLGDHVFRVRVPAGRTVAGFARNGVVYLKFKDGPNRWRIERTQILN